MALDVFELRERVVGEYKDYVESFVNVFDGRIDEFVRQRLDEGELWPDAVLQLNPAFEMDQTLRELAASGAVTPETAQFFGEDLRLFRHQREAIDIAQRDESYVVTTGTGSGKSLTYLVPIYDAIIRNEPERHSVRALLVYPMNALINSQLDALREFQEKNFPNSPVRFDRYTGQDREEDRERILKDLPHILLTNYVMAEYILLRPSERPLLATATKDLKTLVMDELHFYRGRQGADVAMLTRRIQAAAGHPLQAVATSATVASGGSRNERKQTIAGLASRFFGLDIPTENVVDETLRKVTSGPVPSGTSAVRAAVEANAPAAKPEAVREHPLAAWAEEAFGIKNEEGRLIRRSPETVQDAVKRLADESGLPPEQCKSQLLAVLQAGNEAKLDERHPVFAFRLHQWLSSGNSVYATLEPPDVRSFRMEGQYKADGDRILFPLAFCRECGQEYYLVSRIEERQGLERLEPRAPIAGGTEEDIEGEAGFFAIEQEELWVGEDDDLPEAWFDERRSGRVIKSGYAEFRPKKYAADPEGSLDEAGGAGVTGWFQPRPLLICLRCRAVYDRREGDFRKFSSLSQTGRSTATTVGVNAVVAGLANQDLPAEETKSLSFTDNRQDASLQAGHLNDFVQVSMLRAGIEKAIRNNGPLTFSELGPAIFNALELQPQDFLRSPVDSGSGYEQGRRAMIDLLEYRALEDLSRGWRINQPNLEQTGLLRIEYEGLSERASKDSLWTGLPAIADVSPEHRSVVLRAILDHLRMGLAIDAERLTADKGRQLTISTSQWLAYPWRLEETDRLRTHGLALMPGIRKNQSESRQRGVFSLGSRSAVAKYLRSRFTWDIGHDLSAAEVEKLIQGIVAALRGHPLVPVSDNRSNEVRGVRLQAGAMRWRAGDGNPTPPDPVRSRSLHLRREIQGRTRQANKYFASLYKNDDRPLRRMVAAEHTAQVAPETREEREQKFRQGELSTLFCSPTMELGVDIRDLNAVHMRNIPPTPANYAQRSGRAGRGGQPALIVAFAAQGNAHDHYFFRRRPEMIAGNVAPARMDLQNEELVKAHLYSTWLTVVGLPLGQGMADILNLNEQDYPIMADKAAHWKGAGKESIFRTAVVRAHEIVKRTQDIRNAAWFSDSWIEDTLRSAPEAFDRAFDQWRELYRSACAQRDEARRIADDPHAGKDKIKEAERRQDDARREIDLLLNRTKRQDESDFYPYRYLAGEGFLPGYNFPRLPVRTSVSAGGRTQMIDRPRFLGLSEFGPGNHVYHEGRRHRIDFAVLPTADIKAQFTRGRLCNVCGYAHEGMAADQELCEHCGTRLDASTSDFPQYLWGHPAMRTRVVERISSEEEERMRSGYWITTHFSLPGSHNRDAKAQAPEGDTLLDIFYAPTARLWRINHGWRRGEKTGFTIDPQNGRWVSSSSQDDSSGRDPGASQPLTGVKLYVQGVRNILTVQPPPSWLDRDRPEAFLLSLLYALKRAIQLVYQVEEQEVGVDLIGSEKHRRLLFWEEAEGGTGIWERLATEPGELAKVARQALELCHFDPETGEDNLEDFPEKCAVACYECLLTYSNQLHHRQINRKLLPDFLRRLASAKLVSEGGIDRDAQFQRLEALTDPASTSEREFLQFLYDSQMRLPDHAQNRPSSDVYVQPDFYYERKNLPGVCVFLDGSHHNAPERQKADALVRAELEDRGFRVISIRCDRPFADQVQQHPDVFVVEG